MSEETAFSVIMWVLGVTAVVVGIGGFIIDWIRK